MSITFNAKHHSSLINHYRKHSSNNSIKSNNASVQSVKGKSSSVQSAKTNRASVTAESLIDRREERLQVRAQKSEVSVGFKGVSIKHTQKAKEIPKGRGKSISERYPGTKSHYRHEHHLGASLHRSLSNMRKLFSYERAQKSGKYTPEQLADFRSSGASTIEKFTKIEELRQSGKYNLQYLRDFEESDYETLEAFNKANLGPFAGKVEVKQNFSDAFDFSAKTVDITAPDSQELYNRYIGAKKGLSAEGFIKKYSKDEIAQFLVSTNRESTIEEFRANRSKTLERRSRIDELIEAGAKMPSI